MQILCGPEAILGGLADCSSDPAGIAIDVRQVSSIAVGSCSNQRGG